MSIEHFFGARNRRLSYWAISRHPINFMFKDPVADIYLKKLPVFSYSMLSTQNFEIPLGNYVCFFSFRVKQWSNFLLTAVFKFVKQVQLTQMLFLFRAFLSFQGNGKWFFSLQEGFCNFLSNLCCMVVWIIERLRFFLFSGFSSF